ncbi:MAG: DUF3990 domain-containing protein [Prevotellaceae bacterium]|jgi:hypothetical protein|nr:DUF3990 domain-containing protein [Prevotellaceae bacterium]
MRVYHGSYTEITEIDLTRCEPRKDFGQGFYVTKYHTLLFKKPWQEIYEMLKKEMGKYI